MGAAARRRALDRFLQERCTDRTEILYRELLAAHGDENGIGAPCAVATRTSV
jgi:hypothetical protein